MNAVRAGARFPAAPWPISLKVTSGLATGALLAAAAIAFGAIGAAGVARAFELGAVLAFPVIAVIGLLFMVNGYAVAGGELLVERPLWSTRFPLNGLTAARHDPEICKGSLRIFGNGGMYSFTGLYQNARLGRFRLFGTDLRCAVVVRLARRVVVVTPADPAAFVAYLGQIFPAVREGARAAPEREGAGGAAAC